MNFPLAIVLCLASVTAFGCKKSRNGAADASLPDAAEDAAADGSPDGDGGASCGAPPAPYGSSVGTKLEPFTLQRCDGSDYSFYNADYCVAKLTVLSIAAGWCGPCVAETMQLTEQITEPYRDRGVRVIQILSQDQMYRAPTLAYCSDWVDTFGLTNVELIDPAQVTSIYFPGGSLPATVIIDNEGTIRFREYGVSSGLASLRARLETMLAEFEE
jgi:hypothetical protein